jgi:hypothetical protein
MKLPRKIMDGGNGTEIDWLTIMGCILFMAFLIPFILIIKSII